jgi:hypothetical protein
MEYCHSSSFLLYTRKNIFNSTAFETSSIQSFNLQFDLPNGLLHFDISIKMLYTCLYGNSNERICIFNLHYLIITRVSN